MESISEIQSDVAPAEGEEVVAAADEAQSPVADAAADQTAEAAAAQPADATPADEAPAAEAAAEPAEAPKKPARKTAGRRRRVHELAAEAGVDSRTVLDKLAEFGSPAASPASAVTAAVAEQVLAALAATSETSETADAEPAAEAAEAPADAADADAAESAEDAAAAPEAPAAQEAPAKRGKRAKGGKSAEAAPADAEKSDADAKGDNAEADTADADKGEGDKSDSGEGESADGEQQSGGRRSRSRNRNRNRDRDRGQGGQQNGQNQNGQNPPAPAEAEAEPEQQGGGRNRQRNKRRGQAAAGDEFETEISEDDVLIPIAGILDVLDNYAFVRTSGYLAGPNDVYVSMNMVRKNGLRRGDAVTGAVRVPREGDSGGQNPRQKFNPLVRLDTVNGGSVEDAKKRPEFGKLTPLYPNERLRLETTPERLSTRVIDLIMPIGKGQRALIVSPPKAGKTTILQDIANAITRNNPECHLMVVLVDERPEEVTDMQRSVKGEVIASTFDRPPSDHTQAAELAIERAKRLVEQGKDVVVLLDSITRLGRAYNNASPASGRILSGGVDSTALYPPKRFLGAARNIEHGGSLTIIATAMVETGSTGDTVIFEEFKGTGNAELKLDRKIAERRVFPAVDVNPSGTRKDELLLSPDEFAIVHKLRRVLSGLDSHQAIDLLISQLRKTKTNYEFLVQVSKTAPGSMDVD